MDQVRLITGAIENIQASASYDERSRTWVVRLGARRQFETWAEAEHQHYTTLTAAEAFSVLDAVLASWLDY